MKKYLMLASTVALFTLVVYANLSTTGQTGKTQAETQTTQLSAKVQEDIKAGRKKIVISGVVDNSYAGKDSEIEANKVITTTTDLMEKEGYSIDSVNTQGLDWYNEDILLTLIYEKN